jgi:2,3-bisphosphoglycerate-independent phosphoglycerate mutase
MEHCEKSTGKIASIIGRYYAMDRDKRWERLQIAYDLLVKGEGLKSSNLVETIENYYAEDITDEFMKPIVNEAFDGTIKEDEVVIFFNYRNDRAKEITSVLTQKQEADMMPIKGLQFYCMTPYDDSFKGVHILFDKENVQNTLAQYLSDNGKTQLHIAETEKYAHVTFFFNGGVEEPNKDEDRSLVKSPSVATYDLQPEMSAPEVGERLTAAITSGKYDVIVINFANPDMVGHTGVIPAAIKAVERIDQCVGAAVEAVKQVDGALFICADHGNAEKMIDYETGEPHTAHTTNPVPFILVNYDEAYTLREGGCLADIAPTLIQIMGLTQPAEMTGKSLLVKKA